MKSKYFLLLGVSCFLFSGCQSNEKKSQNSVSTSNEPIELKLSDLQEALQILVDNNNFSMLEEEFLEENGKIYESEGSDKFEEIRMPYENRHLYFITPTVTRYVYNYGSRFGQEYYYKKNGQQYVGYTNAIGVFDEQAINPVNHNPFVLLETDYFELKNDQFFLKDEYLQSIAEQFSGDYSYHSEAAGISRQVDFKYFSINLNQNKEIDEINYEFTALENFFGDIYDQVGKMRVLVRNILSTEVTLPTENKKNPNELDKALKKLYDTQNFTYTQTGKSDGATKEYIYQKDGIKTYEYSKNMFGEAHRYTYQEEATQRWYGVFEKKEGGWYRQEQTSYAIEMTNPLNYIDSIMFELVDGYWVVSDLCQYLAPALFTGVYNVYYTNIGDYNLVKYDLFKIKIENELISTIEYQFSQTEYYKSSDRSYTFIEQQIGTVSDVLNTMITIPDHDL